MTDKTPAQKSPAATAADTAFGAWLRRHKTEIGLGLLGLYVLLLAVGTVAELFDIKWILSLPIY